jgi:hypothetical protein
MGQNSSKYGNLQVYNEGKCNNNNMCKNFDKNENKYTSPNAYCSKGKCICGKGFKQLDGKCCTNVINQKGKYICVKHEKQSCPNDETCKNFDFNVSKFTCPDAKCTRDGCDCGKSCKRFEGTCCKDVIFDNETKEYKCVELSGFGYKENNISPYEKNRNYAHF